MYSRGGMGNMGMQQGQFGMNPMMMQGNMGMMQNPYANPYAMMGMAGMMNPMMMGMGMQMGINTANLAEENRRLRDQLERPVYNSGADEVMQRQLAELTEKLSQLDGLSIGTGAASEPIPQGNDAISQMQRQHRAEMMKLKNEAEK